MSKRDLDTGKLDVIGVKKIKEVENLHVADDHNANSVEEAGVETRRMNKRQLQDSLDEIKVKRTKQDEAAIESPVAEASTSHESFQAKESPSRVKAIDSPVSPYLKIEYLFTDDDDDSNSTVENVDLKDCRKKVYDSPIAPDLQLECLFTDEDDGDRSVKDIDIEPPGINEQQLNDNLDDSDSEYRDVDDDILDDIDTDDMLDTDDDNEGDTDDMIQDPGDVTPGRRTHFETEDED